MSEPTNPTNIVRLILPRPGYSLSAEVTVNNGRSLIADDLRRVIATLELIVADGALLAEAGVESASPPTAEPATPAAEEAAP